MHNLNNRIEPLDHYDALGIKLSASLDLVTGETLYKFTNEVAYLDFCKFYFGEIQVNDKYYWSFYTFTESELELIDLWYEHLSMHEKLLLELY